MGEKHKAAIKVGKKVSLLVSILFQLKKDNQLDENLKHLQDKYDNCLRILKLNFGIMVLMMGKRSSFVNLQRFKKNWKKN